MQDDFGGSIPLRERQGGRVGRRRTWTESGMRPQSPRLWGKNCSADSKELAFDTCALLHPDLVGSALQLKLIPKDYRRETWVTLFCV